MPKAKPAAKPPNRRGSPEAIEKRRAGRFFNDVLGGRRTGDGRRDGRTEKRRQRLLHELEKGVARGSRELKPLDVLQRVQELIELGEPISSIRKVAKVRKTAVPPSPSSRSWGGFTRLTTSGPRPIGSSASAKTCCARPASSKKHRASARRRRRAESRPSPAYGLYRVARIAYLVRQSCAPAPRSRPWHWLSP